MEGIDQIKRKGDVLIGVRGNSTTHNVDAAIIIGPLQFFMDEKAGFLPQSRVSLPPLSARLRMTVSNDLFDSNEFFYQNLWIFFRKLEGNW